MPRKGISPGFAWLRSFAGNFLCLALLGLPFIGMRLDEGNAGLQLGFQGRVYALFLAAVAACLLLGGLTPALPRFSLPYPPIKLNPSHKILQMILLAVLVIIPVTGLADRYVIELVTVVLTYIILASGLTIVTGLAGLLDLGYVAFYAIGAYAYALLSLRFGIGFWTALPIVALIAATLGICVGFPALRLRGDYFAVSTLGFAEILRIVITNWTGLTGGPNGLDNIPRITFGPFSFDRIAPSGMRSWHKFWHMDYSPETRVIFSYYVALFLALIIAVLIKLLRRSPLGRSWEALREDEIAAAAVGINPTAAKLSAYAFAAAIGGIAGAFFAARQSFISPESFTFIESATILAIVVLGGLGNLFGAALAAVIVIGLPELFREFSQYRMLAFGAGMVILMQVRPGGLFQGRAPQIRLPEALPESASRRGGGLS